MWEWAGGEIFLDFHGHLRYYLKRTFFVYGFPKSKTANINQGELRAFKNDAKEQLNLTEEQLEKWLRNGTLIEVLQEAENEI